MDHAVVMETIIAATLEDQTLKKVQQALQTGKWDTTDPELAPYYKLRAEIYLADGVMLRNDRIIPSLSPTEVRAAERGGGQGAIFPGPQPQGAPNLRNSQTLSKPPSKLGQV